MSEISQAEGAKQSRSQGTTAERSFKTGGNNQIRTTTKNQNEKLKTKAYQILHRLLLHVRVSLSVGEQVSITATPVRHGFANTKIRFYEIIPLLLLLERLHTSMYNFPSPNLTKKNGNT